MDALLQKARVVFELGLDRFVRYRVAGGGRHKPEHGAGGLKTHPALKIDLL
jgi:hypothetical protein